MQHRQALPVGTRLHEYEVVDVLGSGGFGIVYLAQDHVLAQQVVIKEYLPAACAVRLSGNTVVATNAKAEETFRWGLERFLAEARALAEFRQHPNIVSVLRHFNANNTGYMVMEYAGAMSLQDYLDQRQTLTEAQLEALLLPLLDALEKVHAKGIIHRDLKPGNILINPEGQPILIDFGSARQALEHKSQNMTAIVTPGYSPFEQYTATGKQGPWTDIYALAAVMYRCITGNIPPDVLGRMAPDAPALMTAEQTKCPCSRAFMKAIDWGLQVQISARPSSIAQWRESLYQDSAVSESNTVFTPAVETTVLQSPRRSPVSYQLLTRFNSTLNSPRSRIILLSSLLAFGMGLLLYVQTQPVQQPLVVASQQLPLLAKAIPVDHTETPETKATTISIQEVRASAAEQTFKTAFSEAINKAIEISQGLTGYNKAQQNLREINRLLHESIQAQHFTGDRETFKRLVEERTRKNQQVIDEHNQRLDSYREQIAVLCSSQTKVEEWLALESTTDEDQDNRFLMLRQIQHLCGNPDLSNADLIKDLENIR